MTGPVVLDASAAIPLVHAEPETESWWSVADRWVVERRPIVVPSHFWLECTNTLLRRHRYDGAAVIEALYALDDVVRETIEIDRATVLLALDRAERFALTAYDAAYLALAETLDAELATMDHALARAAGERHVRRPGSPRVSDTSAPYGKPPRVAWPDYAEAAAYLSRLRAGLSNPDRA